MLGFNRNTLWWLFVNSAYVLAFGIVGMLGAELPMQFNKEYSGFFCGLPDWAGVYAADSHPHF